MDQFCNTHREKRRRKSEEGNAEWILGEQQWKPPDEEKTVRTYGMGDGKNIEDKKSRSRTRFREGRQRRQEIQKKEIRRGQTVEVEMKRLRRGKCDGEKIGS